MVILLTDESGITATRLTGKKILNLYWSAISGIKFSPDSTIITSRNSNYEFNTKFIGYYSLLKSLTQFYNSPETDKIKSFFSELSECDVCGYIALLDQKCLSCNSNQPFSDVKQLQYDYFSSFVDCLEDFQPSPEDPFEIGPNWQLLITPEEMNEIISENQY